MKIVLASQSPRRRELLEQMGLEFTTKSPEIDESSYTGPTAQDLVEILSREKALWVARGEDPETIVIGADTVVVSEGRILGKPHTPQEAEDMLLSLAGKDHLVCTGVTVCQGQRHTSFREITQVTFRALTREEVQDYVRTGEPMDKAGAYGIQGYGALLVEGIRGDYNNVVGLPVHRLGQALRDFGVDCLKLAARRP